ncbi:early boundary activity protein 2-like [Bactrocera tryoni]|uniref:early boundary activity protein 2-like n=1 Tax=Bactrocera tryoni TaxID=59916 RepID=UPI001A969FBF|nr:early boundary activity protein 2-like [Bactrocera tryoni]
MSGKVRSRVHELWAASYHGPSIASPELKRRREFETRSNDSKRQRTEAPIPQILPNPVKDLEESTMKDDESKTADNFEALKAAAAAENLVAIGPNGTTVKKEDFDALQWLNAALVTRMLLTLIFDEQTLATHTLSRLSPAFRCQDRLTKPSLDFAKVTDIIYCIRERLGCSEMEIRLPIIMTCSNVARSFKSK